MPTTQKISHKFVGAATVLLMTSVSILHADETVWQDVPQADIAASTSTIRSMLVSDTITAQLEKYRSLTLDENRVKLQLLLAGSAANVVPGTVISLPLPDNTFANVEITPIENASPEIAKLTPNYRAWTVKGTDGKIIDGIIDVSNTGFHAMLNLSNGDTTFIDPTTSTGQRQYASFSKQSNTKMFEHLNWTCGTPDTQTASFSTTVPALTTSLDTIDTTTTSTYRAAAASSQPHGENVLIYDLIVAATDEYTKSHGGSRNAALEQIRRTIDRVNLVMKTDLSIQLRLVGDGRMVADGTGKDGYSDSNDTSLTHLKQLLDQNEAAFKAAGIPSSSYDIGHLFGGINIGGLADVGSVCDSSILRPHLKARGFSGIGKGEIDATVSLDVVAHELGHQLGANHTFNTNGCSSREAKTAVEPGSGSTIMSYAGRCNPSDIIVQNADAMYHNKSIAEILTATHYGIDRACATSYQILNKRTNSQNRNPTITLSNTSYRIPPQTPFVLDAGLGSDADLDTLKYSWEQEDTGVASTANVDLGGNVVTGNNALIRARLPQASPIRTIPQMADLMAGTKSAGEVLPITERSLTFVLNARDGYGGLAGRVVVVNTVNPLAPSASRPFKVTAPNTTKLTPGGKQTVTWDVAGTNNAKNINCQAVDIAVTSDDGKSFTTLLSRVANNGSAQVTLPQTIGTKSHIRVKCNNNIFFSLSATTPHVAKPK
ncbi:hypothetical protein J9253_13555 [Thiothrix litoralis]|uniref:Peptidase M12B domain-containing protein n=1 Tax=Thiothrix litoralis TaxID=2891210 RepID=A0ABX7WQ09_9GAMM|nr:M12 family metallo-peptidase [Thiothrix litoralis]QTR45032.1 hypothetical protein J9253_13555 [Thiothrix litoralis]